MVVVAATLPRRRRVLRWAASVLVLIGLAGVLLYWLVLPWVVRHECVAALEAAGISDVHLKIVRVTPWNLEMQEVQAGQTTPARIASVAVEYSPTTLSNRRISTLRLRGVEVHVSIANGRVDLGPLSGIRSSKGSTESARVEDLPFDRITLDASSLVIHLPGQTLTVSTQGSFSRTGDNHFAIDSSLLLENRPVHLTGKMETDTGDFDLALTGDPMDAGTIAAIVSALVPAARISATGSIALQAEAHRSAGKGTASLHLQPTSVSLSIGSNRAGKSATNVQQISGVIQSEVRFAPGATTSGDLSVIGLSFAIPDAVSADAINGAASFTDLGRMATAPAQTLTVGKLTVGKMELDDGSIVWNSTRPGSIDIRGTKWRWLGGTIEADNFNLDLLHPMFEGTVQLANVSLGQLLATLAPDTASGGGTITGQLPVAVDWPKIRIGTGDLRTIGSGELKIKDLQVLATALGSGASSASADVKKKILEALADFQYDVLRADLVNENGRLTADVHLVGRGRSGAKAPIDAELRVHGVDDLLRLYVGYQSIVSSMENPK
jgi:hypothetical protein